MVLDRPVVSLNKIITRVESLIYLTFFNLPRPATAVTAATATATA